jgi:hypothetical protein
MYSMVRDGRPVQIVAHEVAPLAGSIVIAEVFYKFHSFTLECIAFLGTWFVLSWVVAQGRKLLRG